MVFQGDEYDTIAAIATPYGESGIGIVRISGPEAKRIAGKIFRPRRGPKTLKSHHIRYGEIVDPESERVVDEVLLSFMAAPKTYTREDVVEINCHGGFEALQQVLEAVLRGGAREAQPGEFTKRAFLSGRIDLAQAEAWVIVFMNLSLKFARVGDMIDFLYCPNSQNAGIRDSAPLSPQSMWTEIYHLKILKRENLVRAVSEGRYKRFYPLEQDEIERSKKHEHEDAQILTELQKKIIEKMEEKPEISQVEVAKSLGVSRQLVNYHVSKLVKAGVLKLKGKAKSRSAA